MASHQSMSRIVAELVEVTAPGHRRVARFLEQARVLEGNQKAALMLGFEEADRVVQAALKDLAGGPELWDGVVSEMLSVGSDPGDAPPDAADGSEQRPPSSNTGARIGP